MLNTVFRPVPARSALLFATAALSACHVGPDFTTPENKAPAAYTSEELDALGKGGDQAIEDGASITGNWWAAFHSDRLDDAMKRAFAGNHTLEIAQASLAQAGEAYQASVGAQLPQVTGTAGAGREKYGAEFIGGFHIPVFGYYALGPSVSYLVDYTGGQHRAVEREKALYEEQGYQLRATWLNLTANVAAQAVAIATARAEIGATEQLLDDDQQNLQLVQTAFQAGSVSRLDLLTAQSQLATDETLLPPLRQELSLARHALSILVGSTPAEWSPPNFDLDELTLPHALPLSLPSELAHRRPDILAAEARLHAATADVGVAVANLYPQITLNASVTQEATAPAFLFNGASNAWGLSTSLTQPLFDGGQLQARRRGAEDARQKAFADYKQIVVEAFGDIADRLSALDHDAEYVAAESKALDTSEANMNLTRESYRVGNVGIVQVVIAEREVAQALLNFARARAQRFRDTVLLFIAMGGNSLDVDLTKSAAVN